MKSIKPGRMPSAQAAFMSVFGILFSIVWTAITFSMGAYFMAPFGVLILIKCIWDLVYNLHNATQKNRYSMYDVVSPSEEQDPMQARFEESGAAADESDADTRFCPYCGAEAAADFRFCKSCGKELP